MIYNYDNFVLFINVCCLPWFNEDYNYDNYFDDNDGDNDNDVDDNNKINKYKKNNIYFIIEKRN